jgi:hypothetical protein
MRLKLVFFLLILPVAVLSGQEAGEGGVFPLAVLLETAENGGGSAGFWQPDWPLEIPPDAFRLSGGECRAIRVFVDGAEYRLSRNGEGRITEFPYLFMGELIQIQVEYDGDSRIARLSLASAVGKEAAAGVEADGTDPWSAGPVLLEALEYDGASPSVLRARQGDIYSFILLQWGERFIFETWYDGTGAVTAAYEYRAAGRINEVRRLLDGGAGISRRHYDSRFLLTGISALEGGCSVNYYRQDLPKYWEREGAGHYSFQWDEAGFLVRCYGTAETTASGAETGGNEGFVDRRYEYALDNRGNWVERREFLMTRRFGLLSAVQGVTIRREIMYGEGAWTNP